MYTLNAQPNIKDDKGVDLIKFIMALFVVGLHSNGMSVFGQTCEWYIEHLFFKLAVPYFFIATGYYLGKKIHKLDSKNNIRLAVKKYEHKMLPPFIFWGGCGLIYTSLVYKVNGMSNTDIIIQAIKSAVFYPRFAMWFVLACMVGAAIVTFVYLNFRNYKRVFLLYVPIMYTFALICNSYYFVTSGWVRKLVDKYLDIFISARNGVFVGAVFMAIGFIISDPGTKDWIDRHASVLKGAFLVSTLSYIAEVVFVYGKETADDDALFISMLILIPCFFVVTLKWQPKLNLPYLKLRRLSTSIYYFHPLLCNVLSHLVGNAMVVYIMVVLIAVMTALSCYRIDNKYLNYIT